MSDITPAQLDAALVQFGRYFVWKVQSDVHAVFPGGWFPPSVMLALGLRETNLQNICGGAQLINGQWVPTKTDRGWLQITDTEPTNAVWLKSQLGCPDGKWDPVQGHNALEPLHVPTMSGALAYTLREMVTHRALAYAAGVTGPACLQFIVAAHNAGFNGALRGYREGNVDANTTLGDYSWWVMHYAPQIATWISAHPGWQR